MNKNERIEFDVTSHGIVYGNYTFMIAGWISDYSTKIEDHKSYIDLLDRKGYADDDGRIWIYKETEEEARKLKSIPWFTYDVSLGDYKFSSRTPSVDEAFRVDKIGSLSNDTIFTSVKADDKLYDEDVLNELNASTSVFQPEINETDDFLKRLIKEIILKKHVNIAKYAPRFEKKYELSNLRQALTNDSKTSASNFMRWIELFGVKFHIIIEDMGTDTDPLKQILYYDNYTDRIREIKSLDEVKLKKDE